MTHEEKDKKEYELALLLKNEEDIAGVLALVSQHNTEGATEPRAKRLGLAYEIKKHNEAVFVYYTFKGYGDDIKNLETDLNQRAEVLRFLIIASPAPTEHPTSMPESNDRRRSSRPTSSSTSTTSSAPREAREPRTESTRSTSSSSNHLSNEALEKKIEEILK